MEQSDADVTAAMLADWRRLVTDRPAAVDVDFSVSNRTRTCQRRVDQFLDAPSPETFRDLWCRETMSDYWRPGAATILDEADGAMDDLVAVIEAVRDADAYDSAWETRLNGALDGFGLHELYGRLHAAREPIPTLEATRTLQHLGYVGADDPASVRAGIETFRDRYEREVGHVTGGTDDELPIYAEIDELFRLVDGIDRETVPEHASGEYGDLFRPFLGRTMSYDPADPIEWEAISGLLDDHIEARDSGAYDDLTTEHWGGTHVESWKWQFADYVHNVVKERFDLTDLSAEDVPAFFDAISNPDDEFDVVQDVPRKMMGSRHHQFTWNDLVDHCLENPAEAAATLSDLFDEDLPVEDRLNQFYAFALPVLDQGENRRSPGSLLRAVTTLLMYAYPDRHIAFQYQRIDEFFEAYADVDDIAMGYNPSQYREVVVACRRLREELERRTEEATMIDVQTLIYVAHDA